MTCLSAAFMCVAVALISGDHLAVTQLQKFVPAAEGVIVKEPYGYHSAMTATPARGPALIREAAKRAVPDVVLNGLA
jgi:D-aminopeptidase